MFKKLMGALVINAIIVSGLILIPVLADGRTASATQQPEAHQAFDGYGYGYGYGSTRPGYGYGDRNHEHSGPPGLEGNSHANHGRDASRHSWVVNVVNVINIVITNIRSHVGSLVIRIGWPF